MFRIGYRGTCTGKREKEILMAEIEHWFSAAHEQFKPSELLEQAIELARAKGSEVELARLRDIAARGATRSMSS